VVGLRQEFANGRHTRAPVSLAHDIVGNETVLAGPDGPDARDGRGRVDQDAVEIEEHTQTMNFHRMMIPIFRNPILT